ncbi:MAG: hypothetical protein DI563_25725, partial [Variovorax paradoxus]
MDHHAGLGGDDFGIVAVTQYVEMEGAALAALDQAFEHPAQVVREPVRVLVADAGQQRGGGVDPLL